MYRISLCMFLCVCVWSVDYSNFENSVISLLPKFTHKNYHITIINLCFVLILICNFSQLPEWSSITQTNNPLLKIYAATTNTSLYLGCFWIMKGCIFPFPRHPSTIVAQDFTNESAKSVCVNNYLPHLTLIIWAEDICMNS